MARPRGFDHFCEYLRGFESCYVIIGGGAASILLEEQQLWFRATKDIDLVVLSSSDELNKRILTYVREGGYDALEATSKLPRYYRFSKPAKREYPQQIEIFSRNELGLELKAGQHIIPLTNKYAEKLSAILLDDGYFDLIRQNLLTSATGIPFISPVANICLKARAYREMNERKKAGDKSVDEDDIQKHLKDIFRISAVLTGSEEPLGLTQTILKDVALAIEQLSRITGPQFKQIMKNMPEYKMEQAMKVLKNVFLEKSADH